MDSPDYLPEPDFSPVRNATVPVTPAEIMGAIITQISLAYSGVITKTIPPKIDKIAQVVPTSHKTPTFTFTSPAALICAGVLGFAASSISFFATPAYHSAEQMSLTVWKIG